MSSFFRHKIQTIIDRGREKEHHADQPRSMVRQIDNRVAVQVVGGLGNQLFQYATGRALAARLRAKLIFDRTIRVADVRAFALHRFSINPELACDAPTKIRPRYFRFGGGLGNWITDTYHDAFPRTVRVDDHRFKIVYEKQPFVYDPRFGNLQGSIYLMGWWQSYRYFESMASTIRSELQIEQTPSASHREWLDRIRRSNSVCLHVRRGDYLRPEILNRFGLCQLSYYIDAIRWIRTRIENPVFFVFSDDHAWCRDNLPPDDAMILVDANRPEDVVGELSLMAACRHHIIANSTFSWWAAWLAHHPDQIVIAPDPWFVGEPPARDLLPKRWTRLPSQ
jgi:hypothetical protein